MISTLLQGHDGKILSTERARNPRPTYKIKYSWHQTIILNCPLAHEYSLEIIANSTPTAVLLTSNLQFTYHLAHREKRSQNMAPTTLAASAYRQFHAVVVKAGYMQKTVTARIGDQMFSRRLGKVRFQFILSPHIPPSPSLALPPSFAYCFN